MILSRLILTLIVATGGLSLAACVSSDSPVEPATQAPVTSEPTMTSQPESAISATDTGYVIDWAALVGTPFYAQITGADPYYHIHSTPSSDGFFFSLELYTVYGSAWTGELGTFSIGCSATSTGICAHFDPDGPGPLTDLGADFRATGSVTINQLDAGGYDVIVNELAFSDGTTITGLHLVG
jgi:hypothetical protein